MDKKIDTYVFDLDGTLLDTLPDLVILTNKALAAAGFPERSEAEILSYVGNGVRSLMYQAVPPGVGKDQADETMERWKALYSSHGTVLTKPYPGIVEAVERLYCQGIKLGVLSNKFDQGVQQLVAEYFPHRFAVAHGESPTIPRKPDPTGLLLTIGELGSDASRTAYVGDSPTDVLTAHRAGVYSIGVTWGYHSERELREAGADRVVKTAHELL